MRWRSGTSSRPRTRSRGFRHEALHDLADFDPEEVVDRMLAQRLKDRPQPTAPPARCWDRSSTRRRTLASFQAAMSRLGGCPS
jgi:hypothetical protein